MSQTQNAGCPYCEQGEALDSFACPVCALGCTRLYLFREQSYRGRCLLVLNRHAEEYSQLTREERVQIQEDLYRVTSALEDLCHPGKINLGVFGDTVRHFHIHVVPKYPGELDWGGTFQMNPKQHELTQPELEALARQLRQAISEGTPEGTKSK